MGCAAAPMNGKGKWLGEDWFLLMPDMRMYAVNRDSHIGRVDPERGEVAGMDPTPESTRRGASLFGCCE